MTSSYIQNMLKNPVYAGVYVHGRSKTKTVIESGKPRKIRRLLPPEEWEIFIPESHRAYISLGDFLQNREQLAQNNTRSASTAPNGVAQKGAALLQGIVLCGTCGRKMTTRYKEGATKKGISYLCNLRYMSYTSGLCERIPAEAVDNAVTKHILELVNEGELSLALAVLGNFEHQLNQKKRQWQIKLEQAQELAEKAEQQYKMANSEHSRVYSVLSREWEDAMEQLEKIRQSYAQVQCEERLKLSDEQKQQILRLAHDIPRCWNSPTTTNQERKNILRLLVKQISLKTIKDSEKKTHVQILWHTGAVTELNIDRTKKPQAHKTPDFIIEEIRSLMNDKTDAEVADELNQRGLVSGRKKPFTEPSVSAIRRKYNLRKKNIYKAAPHVVEEIRSLGVSGNFDSEIANELNQRGFTTEAGKPFTATAIRRIRHAHNIPSCSFTTPDFIIEKIRSLMNRTDAEIANELNRLGFVSAARKPFTKEIVVHLRRTHNLNKKMLKSQTS